MRSAMVRSSTSSSSSMTNQSQLDSDPNPQLEVGRQAIWMDNGEPTNGNTMPDQSPPPADNRDPNTLYERELSGGEFPFYVTSAKIYPQDDNANAKKYVSYEITTEFPAVDSHTPTIRRRYTDFLQLYEGLRKEFPENTVVQSMSFPKKAFVGNFSTEIVTRRAYWFVDFLKDIVANRELRDSEALLRFLQDQELERACRLLDERRCEVALPILVNCFKLLSTIYTDRTKAVLLVLCRIVVATSHPIPMPSANKWADLALRRFDAVCDSDLLQLYVPLIKACVYLYWKTGRDKSHLDEQLEGMRKRGINVKTGPTLQQAIHAMDPRTESA